MTLEEAQEHLAANAKNGTLCLCCHRYTKIYTRTLNSTMAAQLTWLVGEYRRNEGAWIYIPGSNLFQDGRQLSTTMAWGLIERKQLTKEEKARGQKRTSGIYRPTEKGLRAADGVVKIPASVDLYQNRPVGWSDKLITVQEATGERFNFAKIMAGDPVYLEQIDRELREEKRLRREKRQQEELS